MFSLMGTGKQETFRGRRRGDRDINMLLSLIREARDDLYTQKFPYKREKKCLDEAKEREGAQLV